MSPFRLTRGSQPEAQAGRHALEGQGNMVSPEPSASTVYDRTTASLTHTSIRQIWLDGPGESSGLFIDSILKIPTRIAEG